MAHPPSRDVTQLLRAWGDGDESAAGDLVPLVYDELHRLAKSYRRRERTDLVLQTTAIINEAYIRLVDARAAGWQSRRHFYATAARVMRRILVDLARERDSAKRGKGVRSLPLDAGCAVAPERDASLLELDEALESLAELDERKGRVVELRFFGGLTEEEVAKVLEVSPETIRRDWRFAKSWLQRYLSESRPNEP